MPDDRSHGWCGKRSTEPNIIDLSTRIVLLTIQMLLSACYLGKTFDLYGVLQDEDGCSTEADVHLVLSTLHVAPHEDIEGEEPA